MEDRIPELKRSSSSKETVDASARSSSNEISDIMGSVQRTDSVRAVTLPSESSGEGDFEPRLKGGEGDFEPFRKGGEGDFEQLGTGVRAGTGVVGCSVAEEEGREEYPGRGNTGDREGDT